MADEAALTRAFSGVEGVFILPPSDFDPAPGYPEARRVITAVVAALAAARPARVVCLSTIGGEVERDNLLYQRRLMEQAVMALDLPLTILRPGWFIENAALDVASAREEGVIRSFLQPADKAVPMVATRDVGRVAAALLQEPSRGCRVVELEGPRRVSPQDLAMAFGRVLGKVVRVEIVARDQWEGLFRSQGMQHPLPRMLMLDGFNEGWIEFQNSGAGSLKGRIDADAVIATLLGGQAAG
jgi:NAD(P)H dehydrogenase (quinone)